MLRSKMMLLATTLILSSGLAGCFGGKDEGNKVDLSALRQQCSELSGYSGNAQFVKEMGIVFVWRADDKEVAECEWNGGDVKLLGILGHSHAGDTP